MCHRTARNGVAQVFTFDYILWTGLVRSSMLTRKSQHDATGQPTGLKAEGKWTDLGRSVRAAAATSGRRCTRSSWWGSWSWQPASCCGRGQASHTGKGHPGMIRRAPSTGRKDARTQTARRANSTRHQFAKKGWSLILNRAVLPREQTRLLQVRPLGSSRRSSRRARWQVLPQPPNHQPHRHQTPPAHRPRALACPLLQGR